MLAGDYFYIIHTIKLDSDTVSDLEAGDKRGCICLGRQVMWAPSLINCSNFKCKKDRCQVFCTNSEIS